MKNKKNIDKKISRRKFLKSMGVAGGTLALSGSTLLTLNKKTYAYENFAKNRSEVYGVLVDVTRCVGCRQCEKACNEWNKLPKPDKPFDDRSVFNKNRRPNEKAYTVVNKYDVNGQTIYRKIQCMHCNEPACASSCPIHAYSKTKEGVTYYNEDRCFGCRYCMTACPYNIPAYDYWSALEPKVIKCTFCYDRLKEGKRTACSEACPTGALTFGKRIDLIKIARERINKEPGKYIDHIYGENEVGGSSWMYISSVPFEKIGLPRDLPNNPLIEETMGFLSAVPIVLTVWPALFTAIYYSNIHRDKLDKNNENDSTKGGK